MTADYEYIKRRVNRFRNAVMVGNLVRRLGSPAIGALFLGAVLQALFSVVPLVALPALFDLSVLLCALALAWLLLRELVLKAPSPTAAARMMERAGRDAHHYLSLALELAPGTYRGSTELGEEVVRRARKSVDSYPRRPRAVRSSRRIALMLGGIILCTASWTMLTPRITDYWDLPFSSNAGLGVRVEPGTVPLPRDGSVTLRLTPLHQAFPSCRLNLFDINGDRIETHILRPDSAGTFAMRKDSLTHSFVYEFRSGGTALSRDTIRVVPPPSLFSLEALVHPPRYTGLPTRRLKDGQGSFSAYAGSRVDFTVGSTFPLRAAAHITRHGDTTALEVDGVTAEGTVPVRRATAYTFDLVDTLGRRADTLPTFYIDLIEDLKPMVRVLKPGRDKVLKPAQQETLLVEGLDDIGVGRLELQWRRGTWPPDSVRRDDLSPGSPKKHLRRQVLWDLKPLELYPGDTVRYWARARDTKPFGTPHIAFSDTFSFRVPGFAEIHQQVLREEGMAQKRLQSVRQGQEELKETVSELVKSATGKEELSWEQKEIVDEVASRLESQHDSLNKAVESLRESVRKLAEEGLSREGVLEKMEEVRKAVEDLVREYGDSLLFDPSDPQKEVSAEELRKSLEKIEEMLPRLEEQLDNTLRFLESLRRDRELAALAARAEKLAREQHRLAGDSAGNAGELRRQQDLDRRAEDFLDELRSRAGSEADSGLFDEKDAPSMAEARAARKKISESLSKGRMPTKQSMSRLSASMLSLSEELEGMLSSAMTAGLREEADMLMNMAYDALTMAEWQEGVRERSRSSDAARREEARRTIAREQQALKQALQRSMSRMDTLTMVPPGMLRSLLQAYRDAGESLDRAIEALGDSDASAQMSGARTRLHALAQTLMDGAKGMQGMQGRGGEGGRGMMAGLRKVSGRQAAINAATADLLRMMLGEGRPGSTGAGGEQGTGGTGQARKQARKAQEAVADRLKALADRYGNEAGGDMEKRVRELEQEARRLAEMMKKPGENLPDRQERFLVRMLQTTLSTHRRDEGKEKRKSKSAVRVYSDAPDPDPVKLFRDTDTFYRLRQRALSAQLPEQYRFPVKAYFDSLGVLYLK